MIGERETEFLFGKSLNDNYSNDKDGNTASETAFRYYWQYRGVVACHRYCNSGSAYRFVCTDHRRKRCGKRKFSANHSSVQPEKTRAVYCSELRSYPRRNNRFGTLRSDRKSTRLNSS